MSSEAREGPYRPQPGPGERLRAYLELTKPRLAFLLVAVSAATFFIAAPRAPRWGMLAAAAALTALLAFGIFALNHYAERETDGLMHRTRGRPLPSRRLSPRQALLFGACLTAAAVGGIGLLFGIVAGAVALFTFLSYIFVYTPLKRYTMHHTILGAISGAMPPLLGWACARASLDLDAWVLFGVLFFWQFPHFLGIELMYRDDYERGGIRVITARHVSTAAVVVEMVLAMALLAGVSILPYFTGLAGQAYLVGAAVLAAAFFAVTASAAARRDQRSGRNLLRASVMYLPLLFLALVLNAR
ncbi:MAG TPA: heme o synthase [Spirochaetia bacterium]|nr:heme o synthase [Spirochaetia bacterium]